MDSAPAEAGLMVLGLDAMRGFGKASGRRFADAVLIEPLQLYNCLVSSL